MRASDLLRQACDVGLNRDDLKNAKCALGIVTLRERDHQTGRTIRWRWSMPTVAPMPTSAPRPLIPHRWGVYSYHAEGRYYFKREQADTFKKLIARCPFDPPLWVLLTTDAALVLPLRISADAVPALGQRWRRLEEVEALAVRKPKARPRELSRKLSRVDSHFRR